MNAELTLRVNIYSRLTQTSQALGQIWERRRSNYTFIIKPCLLLRKCKRSNSRIVHRIICISQLELAEAHRLRNDSCDEKNNTESHAHFRRAYEKQWRGKKLPLDMKKSYRKQERVQKSPRKIQRADIPLSLEFAFYLHKQDGFIACTKGEFVG